MLKLDRYAPVESLKEVGAYEACDPGVEDLCMMDPGTLENINIQFNVPRQYVRILPASVYDDLDFDGGLF